MKTEFLEKLIPESVEGRSEIIQKIFAENGKDVNAEKAKYADYEAIKTDLAAAKDTIGEMERAKGDADALQKQIDQYKQADIERQEAEKAAAARAEVAGRFDRALGERKFAHEYIRSGVLTDFEKALADAANKGKGDTEIFDALTKDKDGIFQSQNPPAQMRGAGGLPITGTKDSMSDDEWFAAYYTEKKG